MDGLVDDALVGLGEHVGQRRELAQPRVQARVAQIHERLRLIPAHARGLAGLGAHLRPAGGVGVEATLDALVGGRRVGHGRCAEAARDRVPPLAVPHALQRLVEPAALRVRLHRDRDRPDHERQCDAAGRNPEPTPPGPERTLELVDQRVHVGEPPTGIGGEATLECEPDRARHLGVARRGLKIGRVHGCRQRTVGVASERDLMEQRPPGDHTERELIRARVDRAVVELLRSHECRRTHDEARFGQHAVEAVAARLCGERLLARLPRCHRVAEATGEPEVQHPHPIRRRPHHHVAGLEVAMHKPRLVRRAGDPARP